MEGITPSQESVSLQPVPGPGERKWHYTVHRFRDLSVQSLMSTLRWHRILFCGRTFNERTSYLPSTQELHVQFVFSLLMS